LWMPQRTFGVGALIMTNFLEVALDCIRRGWFVHPLKPCDKIPITEHGKNDATRDEAKVQAWWADMPNANIGISCAPSGLCVLDADHGLTSMEDFIAWRERNGLPATYAVRSGRRPEFGVQSYYAGCLKDGKFELDGVSGDIKSAGGLVLAAGSLHPSGETYTVIVDAPLAVAPVDAVEMHRVKPVNLADGDAPIRENRNMTLTSIAGKLRNAGLSPTALEAALLQVNADRCEPMLEEEEVKQIAASVGRYALPEPEIEVVFNKPKPQTGGPPRTLGEVLKRQAEEKTAVRESFTDWREMFHTTEDILGCPNPSFLIQDFLQHQAIQAIAAPVGQRKSLIALNVARSLCTGQPLFGFLPVVNKPSRVLYLCPEMGTTSISQRIKNAGLSDHVNKLLFVRSMNLPRMDMLDFPVAALPGSVLILDTAIRFMQGDENSAKDMRMFSDLLFDIQRLQGPNGAIIILYHSPKTTKDVFELTLENCLRGSGELGAAVTDGWGTRMQDPDAGWDSTNFIKHIKVRDYPGPKDFEVSCDKPTGILTRIGDPDVAAVLTVKKSGPKVDPEEAERARAYIKENPNMTVKQLMAGGQTAGISHKRNWWTDRRIEVRGGGSVLAA
jgi:hypothetical protein